MNSKSFTHLLKTLEVAIVVLLLLFADSFSFPNFLRSLISYSTYLFLFIVIIKRYKRFIYVVSKDKLLFVFIIIAITSYAWSESPSKTLDELRFCIRATLFGVYLAMQYTPISQIKLLTWAYSMSVILCIFISVCFPSIGIQFLDNHLSWIGFYPHKQTIGVHMSLAALVFMINASSKRIKSWTNLVMPGLAFFLIIMSNSKLSLVSFIFLLFLMPLYKFAKQKKYRAILFSITLLFSSVLATSIVVNLETIVVQILGKNLEFNGRLPVWTLAIEKALERPWLGYGYNGFWTSNASNYVFLHTWAGKDPIFVSGEIVFHSHNGFLDLFLQLGLLGSIVFILHYLLTLKRIITLTLVTRKIDNFWMFQFLGFFLLINLTESLSILGSNIFWILYVSVSLSSAIEYSSLKKI